MGKSSKDTERMKITLLVLGTAAAVFFFTRAYYHRPESKIRTFQIGIPAPIPLPGEGAGAAAYAFRGDRYFESGAFDRAILEYRNALKLKPRDADTLNDLGLALHYTGRSQEAIKHIRGATAVDPAYQNAWLSLGFVLKAMGRSEESAIALEKTYELNPGTAQGLEAKRLLSALSSPKNSGEKR